jgi:glucose-6-phosphate 1-dehydrogenase
MFDLPLYNHKELKADNIREARASLLRSVKPYGSSIKDYAIRGQYEGYLDTKGVAENSDTETFFKVKVLIDNEKWEGIPFYLESGKALSDSKVEINVYFKEKPSCVCPHDDNRDYQNKISFKIQPDEGISTTFWAKKPGFSYELDEKTFSFNYDKEERLPDAYERVLYDCIRGDQTLFTSTQEVQTQWGIIMPICNNWKNVPLIKYEQGFDPDNFNSEFK